MSVLLTWGMPVRMQLARIFGQIARGAAALSAAFGVYGLRQFPVLAPIILFSSAALAIVSTIASGLQSLASGKSLKTAGTSVFWETVRKTLSDIRAGTALRSVEFSAKGTALSLLGGCLIFAAMLTPPGLIAAGIMLVTELLFLASASYWFRGSQAQCDEQCHLIDNANAANKITDAQANQAQLQANNVRLYNQGAASLVILAICTSVIPIVGPVIAATVALVAAFVWLKAYFSTQAQHEQFDFTHTESTNPNVAHKARQRSVSYDKPAPAAQQKPQVGQEKSKGIDPDVETKHQRLADTLNKLRPK